MTASISRGRASSTPTVTVKDVQAFKAQRAKRAEHNRAELEAARATDALPPAINVNAATEASAFKAAAQRPNQSSAASAMANLLSDNSADAISQAKASSFDEANTRFATVLASEHYAANEGLAQTLLAKSGMTAPDIIEALAATSNRETLKATAEALAHEREEGQREGMRAALGQSSNSNIDPNGGGYSGKADKAKADGDAWDRVYSSMAWAGVS